MRHAARTDPNMVEIMAALRDVGISCEYIKEPMDCLIYVPRRNETALLECKTEEGRFTKVQLEFISRWPGKIYVVRSRDDALRQVLGEEGIRMTKAFLPIAIGAFVGVVVAYLINFAMAWFA